MSALERQKTFFEYLGSADFGILLDNFAKLLAIVSILFGAYVAYLLLMREFKFSIVKKMIEDDHQSRRNLAKKLIEYKSVLMNKALTQNGQVNLISDAFLDESISNWRSLFEISQSMNSEIANVVHLMYQSQIAIKSIVNNKGRNRLHFKNDYYNYYISTVDWLISMCQKIRLFPSIRQVIWPFSREHVFSKKVQRLSTKSGLKTDSIADIGINISGIRRELIAYCNILQGINNPILSYCANEYIQISKYIARLLYLRDHFYLTAFEIHFEGIDRLKYCLFRFEVSHEMIKNVDILKLYYLPQTRFFKIEHKTFFSRLKKDKEDKHFVVDECNTSIKYKVPMENMKYSELYGSDMVIIEIPYARARIGI